VIAGRPLSSTAQAQVPPAGGNAGVPDAGLQRQQIVDEMRGARASLDALRKTIEGGKVKVVIGNVDELKNALKTDDKNKGK